MTTLSSTVTLQSQIEQFDSLDRLGEFATLHGVIASYLYQVAIASMALWLLCCVLLFITSRGYVWLSHQSWFLAPELSLPWLLLGGIGLAIASNRQAWPKDLTQLPPPAIGHSKMTPNRQPGLDKTSVSSTATIPAAPKATQRPRSSISFEIPTTAKATARGSQTDTHTS